MANFFAELKRRHIYRVTAAYAVVAWVLVQLVNNVAPALRLPEWAPTLVIVLLLVGFPITLLLAWMRELAPADGEAARAVTSKLDWALMGALVVVIALVSYQQLVPSRGTSTGRQQVSVSTTASIPGGISVAVLPFVNLSDDRQQEFFSDGMTEEITAALAQIQGLRVTGRTSAFEFKGQNRDLRTIGQALGVSHLIEGSVRKAGNRVRITAQLVRAADDSHLWAENYDRDLTDVFAIQEEIAQAIAAALRVPLGLRQGETLVSNRTSDLESYQQYLRARALVRARAIIEAINVLEPVVASDPNYAPAWALLAMAYTLAPTYPSTVPSGAIEEERRAAQIFTEKAEMAARKAIQLDTRHAAGYGALADSLYRRLRGNWAEAEDIFKQALTFDSNDPEVLHAYRQFLNHTGRLRDTLSISEKLRTLEPFVPVYNIVTASNMQMNGQNAASISILEAIPADAAAGGYNRNAYLARAYAGAGRFAEAADTLLLIKGNRVSQRSVQDAARLLRAAPANVNTPETLPSLELSLNFVYAYAGVVNRVMESPEHELEIHYANTSGRDLWLPLYAPLRKTERFKAYVRALGLVDYWRARGWPDRCRPMGADDFACD